MSVPPIDVVLARLKGVQVEHDGQWNARCPNHDDNRNSLGVSVADDGKVLLRCLAGCKTTDVVAAAGLRMADLFPKTNGHSNGHANGFKIVAEYPYHDEQNRLLFQACRMDPKDFRQRRPNGAGGWEWTVKNVRKVLYRLPELLAADKASPVFVVEGEKDADRLRGLGLISTTNVGGAGKWKRDYAAHLTGRNIVILPDNDQPGRDHAADVATKTRSKAASVKVIELPGLPEKGDVSDWLNAGGTKEELLRLVSAAPEWLDSKAKAEPETPGAQCDRSDLGNARLLVKLHGDKLRFCHPWDAWTVWNEKQWAIDQTGQAERLAKDVADYLWREAKRTDNTALRQFASETASSGALSAMLRLARSEPLVPVLPSEMDRDPWLLNCANGTLNLRTGELGPHRREDLLTKLCPTRFEPDAASYHWDHFLEAIFDGKQSLIEFMQRFLGYCLTGDVREQILAIFWGGGSNGKTTLLKAYMDALGLDYASKAVPELLLNKRNESHPTERADLFGKRFVACVETNDGRSMNEALVKELTGSDSVKARRLYEDFWEFVPTHKAILCTNHRPTITGGDHAIWRRLALIPFAVTFWDAEKGESGPPELRQDKALPIKLAEEREGILAWAVRGCLEWQQGGLVLPDEVRAATAEYRAAEDTTQAFVAECCLTSEVCKVRATPLYDAYRKWSEARGETAMSQRRFGEAIAAKGFKKMTSNGTWYAGVALLDTEHGE